MTPESPEQVLMSIGAAVFVLLYFIRLTEL